VAKETYMTTTSTLASTETRTSGSDNLPAKIALFVIGGAVIYIIAPALNSQGMAILGVLLAAIAAVWCLVDRPDLGTSITGLVMIAFCVLVFNRVTADPRQAASRQLQQDNPGIIMATPVADDGSRATADDSRVISQKSPRRVDVEPMSFNARFTFTPNCIAVLQPAYKGDYPLSQAELDQILDTEAPDGSIRARACTAHDGDRVFSISGDRGRDGIIRWDSGLRPWRVEPGTRHPER
jgi:hypothetical protein